MEYSTSLCELTLFITRGRLSTKQQKLKTEDVSLDESDDDSIMDLITLHHDDISSGSYKDMFCSLLFKDILWGSYLEESRGLKRE